MDVADLTARCDAEERSALAVFEEHGRWISDETEPAVLAYVGTYLQRWAWHASLWAGRRPSIGADPASTRTGPTSSEPASPVSTGPGTAAATPAAPPGPSVASDGRLVDWCERTLPARLDRHRALLVATDPLVDGPTHRLLELVVHDELAALADAETILVELRG